MHGANNDYIYVDTTRYPIENPEELSKEWSTLYTGIGSDGLVLIGRSGKADFSMRIFNADGPEARMCGNASRCTGKYLYGYELTSKTEITLDTLSGIKTLKLHVEDNKADTVVISMSIPAYGPTCYDDKGGKPVKEHPIEIDGMRYMGAIVSMGNPHLVIFVDNITRVGLPAIGPKLGNHPFFPERINVEFAQVLGEGRTRVRVWERDSGITQACGTGARATAVTAFLTGRSGGEVTVIMDGGAFTIKWDVATGHILMTGNAIRVFNEEAETNDE